MDTTREDGRTGDQSSRIGGGWPLDGGDADSIDPDRLRRMTADIVRCGMALVLVGVVLISISGHAVNYLAGQVVIAIMGTLIAAGGVAVLCSAPTTGCRQRRRRGVIGAGVAKVLATIPPEPMLLRVSYEPWKLSRVSQPMKVYVASLYPPGAADEEPLWRCISEPVWRYIIPTTYRGFDGWSKDGMVVGPLGDAGVDAWPLAQSSILHPVMVYPVGDPAEPVLLVDMGERGQFLCTRPYRYKAIL